MRVKQYLKDENGDIRRTKPLSLMIGPYNQEGSKEIAELLGRDVFEFPKPMSLVRFLASLTINDRAPNEGVLLDFTAGSGTAAHAVLDLNKQDHGNRKFILVQLPELTGREDYHTIADITKERVRRVIKKLNEEDAGRGDLSGEKRDRGFRVFKLAESNLSTWDADEPKDAEALEKQLDLHVRHIRQGRTEQDLLYEILLKDGFPPTTPVEQLALAGKRVYSAAEGSFLISLERELTLELIRALAERKPERVVLLDEGFAGNDQLKTNAVKLFESQGVTRFRTV